VTCFFLRAAVAALGLWLASEWVDGLSFDSGGTVILAAVLLGIVNALVRPLAILLTLPLTIVTLGLFLLVLNALMLGLVAAMLDGFQVVSFWDAFWGAIIVSVVSWLGSALLGPKGDISITIQRR
jgi:putative membrane protein